MSQKTNPFLVFVSAFQLMENRLEQSEEFKGMLEKAREIVAPILNMAKNGDTVEDLLEYEVHLQSMDRFLNPNPTPSEKAYLKNAEAGYKMIARAVGQMRKNPKQYFEANQSLKEVGDDFRKFPTTRLSTHIKANVQRLQNRALDLTEPKKAILRARILLAKATLKKLRELHECVVEDRERKQRGRDA